MIILYGIVIIDNTFQMNTACTVQQSEKHVEQPAVVLYSMHTSALHYL